MSRKEILRQHFEKSIAMIDEAITQMHNEHPELFTDEAKMRDTISSTPS